MVRISLTSNTDCCWYLLYRNLQVEYDQLKQAQRQNEDLRQGIADGDCDGSRDAEMIAEAKLLRQHKGRLEARMQILEDHNRQLEAQLLRLRQLLDQVRRDTCEDQKQKIYRKK